MPASMLYFICQKGIIRPRDGAVRLPSDHFNAMLPAIKEYMPHPLESPRPPVTFIVSAMNGLSETLEPKDGQFDTSQGIGNGFSTGRRIPDRKARKSSYPQPTSPWQKFREIILVWCKSLCTCSASLFSRFTSSLATNQPRHSRLR